MRESLELPLHLKLTPLPDGGCSVVASTLPRAVWEVPPPLTPDLLLSLLPSLQHTLTGVLCVAGCAEWAGLGGSKSQKKKPASLCGRSCTTHSLSGALKPQKAKSPTRI